MSHTKHFEHCFQTLEKHHSQDRHHENELLHATQHRLVIKTEIQERNEDKRCKKMDDDERCKKRNEDTRCKKGMKTRDARKECNKGMTRKRRTKKRMTTRKMRNQTLMAHGGMDGSLGRRYSDDRIKPITVVQEYTVS